MKKQIILAYIKQNGIIEDVDFEDVDFDIDQIRTENGMVMFRACDPSGFHCKDYTINLFDIVAWVYARVNGLYKDKWLFM